MEAEEIDHLLFEDESMIRSYQALRYNWFPRGKQRQVPTYGKHEGAKLFGAIHYVYKIKLQVSQFMKRIIKQPMETIDRLLIRF
ncbi:hypothetical protein C1I60_01535 [Paenibacillus terrae]|uniref:Uncharacterized protein n=1 Tax=Paenibacillus terrae TaxID=159743 RepID=A0A4U2Q3I9_9BACL|nr:hypothetical protein [Paenibacillus terrae]TKH46852.1 hypothetical protein C1I60_01535 [Paenibacillus terrae]